MSTRTGFPRMDWDTGFLADPKFQHLRDLLPDPIQFGYAAFCFIRLTADAWRTCDRRAIHAVVRGIPEWTTDALREAGLLEDDRLPAESYDKWVGSALGERAASRDRQRSHRESRSVTVTNSAPRIGRTDRNGRTGESEGDRRYQRLVETRIRNFHETGQWDPDWGPEPDPAQDPPLPALRP